MAACSVGTKNASVERDMQQSWMAAWRDDRSVTPRLEWNRTADLYPYALSHLKCL